MNILANDLEALARFYEDVFGFPEIESHRSPIYRCLDAGGVELGFNAPLARQLLNIPTAQDDRRHGGSTYITFELETLDALEDARRTALSLGARELKAPYDTYYNARQCVLEDPEGNVFRLNLRKGPRAPAEEVKNPPWVDHE